MRYKKDEILNMTFLHFLEVHRKYFANYVRIKNCALVNWEHYLVSDVCNLTEKEIIKDVRYLGKKSIKEIKCALSLYNLRLAMPPAPPDPTQELKEQLMRKLTPMIEDFVEKLIKVTLNETGQ